MTMTNRGRFLEMYTDMNLTQSTILEITNPMSDMTDNEKGTKTYLNG